MTKIAMQSLAGFGVGLAIIVCALWLAEGHPKAKPLEPNSYECQRASAPIKIDGKLNEAVWRKAVWTEYFVDIEGDAKPRPAYKTRVKMLWDDDYFYFAAELEEPHVWGTLTKRDSVIFHDNDFEVFIDPEGDTLNYYEIEINALNTVWDLQLDKPYRHGGKANDGWNATGMKTAVSVAGTINNPKDKDRGWSVEIALPWKDLTGSPRAIGAPKAGDRWRVNFSRVEWQHTISGGKYSKVAGRPEDNWVWSPQGEINMHVPEKWGYVRFAGK
jgi:hypothetical protein